MRALSVVDNPIALKMPSNGVLTRLSMLIVGGALACRRPQVGLHH